MRVNHPKARLSRLFTLGLLMCALTSLVPNPGAARQTAKLGEYFDIRGRQTVTVNGTKLSITVLAVHDTRCPKNYHCYWPGNATVQLVVTKLPNAVPVSIEVNTHGGGKYPRERQVHGYIVRLVKLSPHRDMSRLIMLKDYRFTLVVQ